VTAEPTSTRLIARQPSRWALQRRVLTVLVVSQLLGGAGLAAGITVGALLAQDMLGSTGLAGLPAALFTAGSAAAALEVGRVSQRYGRRPGLALGYLVGAVGGAGVAIAAVVDSVWLLLAALTIYGSGTATNLQARYAGADLADPEQRGRAISIVLVATTAGAVAGPNLVGITGDIAAAAGAPPLSGPFVLAATAYALAGIVLLVFLRPDPLLVAMELSTSSTGDSDDKAGTTGTESAPGSDAPAGVDDLADAAGADSARRATSRRMVLAAAAAMVLTQVAMVAVMTMTPVHLIVHGHGLDAVGVVIAVHIAAMFLPSPVTGWLADRCGRPPVLAAAGVVLTAAGLIAALADPDSLTLLTLALGLLGLGWNLGLIGGTALVTDVTAIADRARTQGSVDLTIALAGATGGIASGGIVAAAGYPQLALLGGLAGLLMLPIVVAAHRTATPAGRTADPSKPQRVHDR